MVSETDVVSGETVTYSYDNLNRLASAVSSVNPGWGQSFGYDGFGNLTNVSVTKGSAPSLTANTRIIDIPAGYHHSYSPSNLRGWRGKSDGSVDER
ncbi:MAG: hypothetical protein WDO18_08685 [Acidobacteriota bacterium]